MYVHTCVFSAKSKSTSYHYNIYILLYDVVLYRQLTHVGIHIMLTLHTTQHTLTIFYFLQNSFKLVWCTVLCNALNQVSYEYKILSFVITLYPMNSQQLNAKPTSFDSQPHISSSSLISSSSPECNMQYPNDCLHTIIGIQCNMYNFAMAGQFSADYGLIITIFINIILPLTKRRLYFISVPPLFIRRIHFGCLDTLNITSYYIIIIILLLFTDCNCEFEKEGSCSIYSWTLLHIVLKT